MDKVDHKQYREVYVQTSSDNTAVEEQSQVRTEATQTERQRVNWLDVAYDLILELSDAGAAVHTHKLYSLAEEEICAGINVWEDLSVICFHGDYIKWIKKES